MESKNHKGQNYNRRGKMIRKANHGTRPIRRRCHIRMARGHG